MTRISSSRAKAVILSIAFAALSSLCHASPLHERANNFPADLIEKYTPQYTPWDPVRHTTFLGADNDDAFQSRADYLNNAAFLRTNVRKFNSDIAANDRVETAEEYDYSYDRLLRDKPWNEWGDDQKWLHGLPRHWDPVTQWRKTLGIYENKDVLILGPIGVWDMAMVTHPHIFGHHSFLHTLGIIKTKHIYNGASVDEDTVKYMELIRSAFEEGWSKDADGMLRRMVAWSRESTNRYAKSTIDKIELKIVKAEMDLKKANGQERDGLKQKIADHKEQIVAWRVKEHIALTHWKELSTLTLLPYEDPRSIRPRLEDFKFGLHLYPNNSVPNFHAHVSAQTEALTKYCARGGLLKTFDLAGLIRYVKKNGRILSDTVFE